MAKEFTWKGKSEDDAAKLDLDEFVKLIPSRQRRSLKRGLTEAQQALMKRVESGENNVKTHCRDMIILPKMVGKTLRVYNGKEYLPIMVTAQMLGHYLGEFSHTRKGVTHSAAGLGATRSSKAVSAR
ncbi:MAG: 30S ribosomal protein S19 [Nanoarchaeota archaeon]